VNIKDLKPTINPIIVISLGIIAVSTSSIFIRFAQGAASSLVISAYRLGLATIILIPISAGSGKLNIRAMDKKQIGLVVLSGVFLAFHFATWITSLAYTSVASSIVLVDTSPLWVTILAALILRERITSLAMIGLALTLIGSVIIGMSDLCHLINGSISCPSIPNMLDTKNFIGDLLALAGAFFASGYLLIGRVMRPKMTLNSYIFFVYGVAAIVLWGMVGFTHQTISGFPPVIYIWLIALAVIPQLIGHSSFNWALGYLSTAFVSISLLGEPIGSIILAFLILREIPSEITILGAIFILIGIILASRGENRKKEINNFEVK
jgi:drug/metabolite transporter (DMT)-like permease